MAGSYWLPIGNHTLRIQWSHDRWRHVTRKFKVVTPIHLNLNISITGRDIWSVLIDHLSEPHIANGRVTDDVTWPKNVKVITQIFLKLNISTTVWGTWSVDTDYQQETIPWESSDRWRHVTRKVKVVTEIHLNLNISIAVRDRRSVPIDHL